MMNFCGLHDDDQHASLLPDRGWNIISLSVAPAPAEMAGTDEREVTHGSFVFVRTSWGLANLSPSQLIGLAVFRGTARSPSKPYVGVVVGRGSRCHLESM